MKKIKTQLTSENESNVLVIGAGETVATWTLRLCRLFNWQRHLNYISINFVTLKPKTSLGISCAQMDTVTSQIVSYVRIVYTIFKDQRIYTEIKRKDDSILSQ